MSDRENLRRQFERNKERFEQARAKIQKRRLATRVLAAAAVLATSIGGIVFGSTTKFFDQWLSPRLSETICRATDIFRSNEAPQQLTVVILPLQNDDSKETNRRAVAASFFGKYGVNVITPCESVNIREIGDADAARRDYVKAMASILHKYDPDLLIFGDVRDRTIALDSVSNDTVQFLSGSRLHAKLVEAKELENVAHDFDGAMLDATIGRLKRVGCDEFLFMECTYATDLRAPTEIAVAVSRAEMITAKLMPSMRTLKDLSPNFRNYMFLMFTSSAVVLNLLDKHQQKDFTNFRGETESFYTYGDRMFFLAEDFARYTSDYKANRYLVQLGHGFFEQRRGEACQSLQQLLGARETFIRAISYLDMSAQESPLRANEELERQFARLWLARTEALLLAWSKLEKDKVLTKKELSESVEQLKDGPREVNRQLNDAGYLSPMFEMITARFATELEAVKTINTRAATSTANLLAGVKIADPKLCN
jgi:hypothetical protein